MGIYDREYIRREESGIHLGGPLTVTTRIIIVTAAVYAIQLVTNRPSPGYPAGWFNDFFALHADWIKRPWMAFELVTYGFMHSVTDLRHILFNMLVVWFLGRALEYRYGQREYLAFYLTSIAAAGLVWSTVQMLRGDVSAPVWGASGACSAVLVLFAFNWPRQQILLFFVIPMPVWLAAALAVGYDMYHATQQTGNIAFEAHLGGAAFALLYHRFGWQLTRLLPAGRLPRPRRSKLRVHQPDGDHDEPGIDAQVDAILRKIQRQGQQSLTRKERKLLEEASREYQKKKR
jgi:membrane associated rhomboid family serine protease